MTGPAIKSIFLFIIGLNVATIIFMSINMFKSSEESEHLAYYTFLQEMQEDVEENEESYHFINPSVAYRIWQQLDIYEGRDERKLAGANYLGPGEGFKVNFDYCDEHRLYIVNNPEFVFNGKNFFTNYWETHKLRTQVLPSIVAHDLYPELIPGKRVKPANSDMRPDINIFITFNLFYYKRQVGKQFSCISQASNHIPGHDKMYRKDLLAQSLAVYAKKYTDRPRCFNYDKYFPKTWVLIKKDQCLEFFQEFNSPLYQELKEKRNVVYFRKIGAFVHEGLGVFPVNDKEEQYIRNLYGNGKYCGQIKENNLIQYNVYNLLLIENRKFGFRKFMLVASANPVIAYYHDGYARLSLNEYDPSSDEKKTFVTNIGVNLKEATQGTELQNLTPEQINDYTHWTLEDIANYLYEKGKISDPNWLNNSLKESFKKVMIHLIRMTQEGFYKKSSIYELYGLDFVMDEDLNLWFIEANSMPLVNGFTARSTIQMNQMLKDSFEIVLGLTKSRMKRVIAFINMLTKDAPFGNIVNLEKRRQEYKELTKNYFEPEFEPSPQSSFYKIIDETYTGVKRYSNLLEEQCL